MVINFNTAKLIFYFQTTKTILSFLLVFNVF
nr:MAG TPA_asm: hypothetical protein [Caudoviricetes sp.]